MEWSEYVPLAMRTASPRDPENHGWIGLITETGELADFAKKVFIYGKSADATNLREEIGDVLWYVALECNRMGIDEAGLMWHVANAGVRYYPVDDMVWIIRGLCISAGKYAAAADEVNKPALLGCIFAQLCNLIQCVPSTNLGGILDLNIEKLAKRFGDKYSDFKVLNRDLDAERLVLEGSAECAPKA